LCEEYEKERRVTALLENDFRECLEAGKDLRARCACSEGNYC